MPPRGRKRKNVEPLPEDQKGVIKSVRRNTETPVAAEVKDEKPKVIDDLYRC
jgi:hypothetical protein